jgi:predicted Zn-dependent protease
MNLPVLHAPRGRFPCLSILCFVAFVAWGCATEPITGRWTLAPVPETTTSPMGTQAYAEILKDAKISTDAAANELVSRVGKRIAAVTDAHMKEENREPFQWEFKVIDDPKTVNAWCLPGGKVAFYTAILPVCKDENGIAVVMGHEVAHAYAQHGGRRMSEQGVANVGLQAVALALGGEGASDTAKLTVAALGIGYQVGVQLPFSRKDESSADYIGLMLMSEAGYDPRASVEFWKRMIQATGGAGPPEFLSTHPDPSNRIQRLEELMPKALEIYEKSKAKGGAAQIP